tara:strand:+ start:639 stop:1091 length:453 start_codon:yes stop_codon:yes gene_type:complete
MKFLKFISIIIMSMFYIGVGIGHFIMPEKFLIIIPKSFPFPFFLVYASGFFEIIFGVLLLFKKFRFFASIGLILLLIAVFPANIFLYLDEFARQAYGGVSKNQALVRMFFQIPLIFIAYWHSKEFFSKWFNYFGVIISIPTILYFLWILF